MIDKIIEKEAQELIIIKKKIKNTYFTENCDVYDDALELINKNVNIKKSLYSGDTVNVEGNFILDAAVGTVNNISFKGNSFNANNSIIFSELGNIDISFNNTNITGLVYAPNGKITIDSNHVQINGVLIAKEIEIIGKNVNINYNENIAKIVGITSESLFPEHIQIADGEIDAKYLYNAIYPNLILKDLSTDNVLLADDYDEDGLTLIEEYEYDTNPFSEDTDEDGLCDYQEIMTCQTKPCYWDTDHDGMVQKFLVD